jgi:hypothetical protein
VWPSDNVLTRSVLNVASDRFALVPGKPLEKPVTVERWAGLTGEIEISAAGLPKGVTATASGGKSITLRLTSAGEPASGSFRILGSIKDRQDLKRAAFASLPDYGTRAAELWLTVGPSAAVLKETPPKKN